MFNYLCEECGKGTVRATVFHDYKTRIRGYPFIVPEAVIGVCDNDNCRAKHFNSKETKRWEELYNKDLESKHVFLSTAEILELRKSLGLSMEDFAYLIGSTRQSIYNWEKMERQRDQSRMADLLIKLVRYSSESGRIDVINFLVEETKKLGIGIDIQKKNIPSPGGNVIPLTIRKVSKDYFEVLGINNLKLAAITTDKELIIAESPKRDLIAVLEYDFETANLSLHLINDSFGVKMANIETITNDDKHYELKNEQVRNNIVLLIPETKYRENDIKEIQLQPTS